MILETGDMWSVWGKTDLFCITTNSTVLPDGRLVMGKGIAKEARDTIVGLDARLGRMVGFNQRPYGLLILNNLARDRVLQPKLGAFQTKYSYSQASDLNLIRSSCASLWLHLSKNPNTRVDVNFPGVGAGNLSVQEVWPVISLLPDNVHVWCDTRTHHIIGEMLWDQKKGKEFVTRVKWDNILVPPYIVTSAVTRTNGDYPMERGVKGK